MKYVTIIGLLPSFILFLFCAEESNYYFWVLAANMVRVKIDADGVGRVLVSRRGIYLNFVIDGFDAFVFVIE